MADTRAITFVESVYRRTDQQIRDILAVQQPTAEVDTINVILGDGVTVMHPGIGAAIRVDFRARITGFFLQEFDGTTGSVGVVVEQSQGGPTPVWTRISPLVTPAIVLQNVRGNLFFDIGGANFPGQPYKFASKNQLVNGVASVGYGLSFNFLGLELHWDFAKRTDLKHTQGGTRTEFWIGETF